MVREAIGENIAVGGWWLAVGLVLCALNKLGEYGLDESSEFILVGGLGCDGVEWGGNRTSYSLPFFTH